MSKPKAPKAKSAASKSARSTVKKPKAAPAATPQRTQRGRPPRLSQQVVIAKTVELLGKKLPEEITLAVLAKELHTATVTLYKYFPNRDAVLNAVGEHFYSLFAFPTPPRGQRWQDTLLDWLWAVHRHIGRNPLATRAYGVDGQLSTAIMKMCAPAHRVLEEQGLQGKELAFASAWFINHAFGLIFNELSAGNFRQPAALHHIVDLAPEDQEAYLALRPFLTSTKSEDVLDFGFALMIEGLERLIAKAAR